jgi:glycerol uptake facilitator-like aquaporin
MAPHPPSSTEAPGATNGWDGQVTTKPTPPPWWSNQNAMTMCTVILVFGLLVMVQASLLALRRLDKDTILKVVVIPMAVVSAIFLVVAGYSDSQIAPAMGLLGTIVGYVLGTARSQEQTKPAAEVAKTEGQKVAVQPAE